MKLLAGADRLIIQPAAAKTETEGGIILPEGQLADVIEGEVLNQGLLKGVGDTHEHEGVPGRLSYQVGAVVGYHRHDAIPIEDGSLHVVRLDAILFCRGP